jgi:hypothetical protein
MNLEDDPLGGRAVWSDADFEQMGWHDATVWGIAFVHSPTFGAPGELVLDIDYIVQWIEPVPPDEYFTFAVAPATLVFHEVWKAQGDLDAFDTVAFEIDSIERGEPENDQQREQNVRPWIIEGSIGLIVVASGFDQHFRCRPIGPLKRQHLRYEERGGISFACPMDFVPRT